MATNASNTTLMENSSLPAISQVTFFATGGKRLSSTRDNTILYWPTSVVLFKPAMIMQVSSDGSSSNAPRIMVATAMKDHSLLSALQSFVNDSLPDKEQKYKHEYQSTENLIDFINKEWPSELKDSNIRAAVPTDSQTTQMLSWLGRVERTAAFLPVFEDI